MGLIIVGDSLSVLEQMPDECVDCCVTSPPYYGLRDYGTATWSGGDVECDHVDDDKLAEHLRQQKSMIAVGEAIDGSTRTRVHDEQIGKTWQYRDVCRKCGALRVDKQIGLEQTPDEYVTNLVNIFREVRRVMKPTGTLWLNLGDSYAANRTYQVSSTKGGAKHGPAQAVNGRGQRASEYGLKPKDLIGIPWAVAFALRMDGWYLRSDIIWHKPNVMPSSVKDRCTTSHEYIFMLSKSSKYYFDADAIAEESIWAGRDKRSVKGHSPGIKAQEGKYAVNKCGVYGKPRKQDMTGNPTYTGFNDRYEPTFMRNKRDVWSVNTKPFKEAHFATFPPDLIRPMILAGCPEEGVVLDPFFGAGTVGVVGVELNRDYVGIDLNPEYCQMAKSRIGDDNCVLQSLS